ncbi:hypothetical protein QR680_018928 [Steinernema hermaphroditum]|uniref:Uncharacterized protein n=1 Tax=Steinernema hermaphroditum TaxID=289476 RepID=A0AA39LRK8_9BILA|nr:hypothetical protein QR680_018928 [Steinernema hermaphroditum]
MPSQASTYRAKREKERDISEKIALGLPDTRAHAGETHKNIDKDIYGSDLDAIISANKFVPRSGFAEAGGKVSSGRGAGSVQQLKRERCREDDGAFSSKKGRK